ncbi:MAG: hypothetical protein LBR07_03810, partial [Puniceicoccales bacterium]|nr:hypothetical protein [Puniceicoccales bacterium]
MSAPRSTQSATGGAAAGNATAAAPAASSAADAVVPGAPGVPLPPVSGAARFINPYSDFGFKRIFGQE